MNLREDKYFTDVTLACEDGQQVEAHKVILAGSSPFFQKLLKRNHHPHPLIFMRNVSSENLEAIVDFLYFGEANVFEQNLETFLAIAEELKLKGLSGENLEKEQIDKEADKDEEAFKAKDKHKQVFKVKGKEALHSKPEIRLDKIKEELDIEDATKQDRGFEYEVLDPISNDSADLSGHDEDHAKSMMEKSVNLVGNGKDRLIHSFKCKICGKEGRGQVIKKHIKSTHLGKTCSLCGQKFASRDEREMHEIKNQDCKKLREHTERVNSLMVKSENWISNGKHTDGKEKKVHAFICNLCGKEGRPKSIREHIELSHLEDVAIPCNKCGETFTSRSALKLHNEKSHTEVKKDIE